MPGAKSKLSDSERSPLGHGIVLCRFAAFAILLAFCGNLLYAGQPKPRKNLNRHQIEQIEEAWRAATLKDDAVAMSALMADDFIAITSSGTLQTKEETLANLRSRRLHITSLTISDRKLRFYGKTALVTSLAFVQGTTPEGDLNGSFRYTRIYVLNPQGEWKIVSFEASRIRVPGEARATPQSPRRTESCT